MIRKLVKEDIPRLVAIWHMASIQAHPFIEATFWDSQKEAMRTVYLPSAETLVYEDNKCLQGFISYKSEAVAALFVDPAFQSQGIGYALLQEIQAQYSPITLTVYAKNYQALTFYARQGFTILTQQFCEYTGQPESVLQWIRQTKDD